MDDFTGSAQVTSTSDSSGENLNSAPPQLPSESEMKNNNYTPNQETPYYNGQNYNANIILNYSNNNQKRTRR